MTTTEVSSAPLLSPEEIAARQQAEAPQILFPDLSQVFRERELRLRQLAAGHAMRDYLVFMADVAAAQHRVARVPRALRLPQESYLAAMARAGSPPLDPQSWRRDGTWREELAAILDDLAPRLPPTLARDTVLALRHASAEAQGHQADRLLARVTRGLDLAQAPLVGAALQVHWARLVGQLQARHPDLAFGRVDDGKRCPCCGGLPVASIMRIGGREAGARYLHCSLCQAQWHMVRIRCARCERENAITYAEAEPAAGAPATAAKGAVRAECCGECRHYLKIVAMDKDPHVDPVADDLASLTLDLLAAEDGLERHGVNFMLLFGPGEEEREGAG